MFGPHGHAYVYRSYGIHLCLNVVAQPGEAVLLRAISPRTGIDLMKARRTGDLLCNGPGRLSQALGINPNDDGASFEARDFSITLADRAFDLLTGQRIGITKAQDFPWRFGLAGAEGFSRPFR